MQRKKANYWSDGHHAMLVRAAQKALERIPTRNVSIDELISIGWLSCLRHRTPDKLHNCFNYTYYHMLRFLTYESRWENRLSSVLDFDVEDSFNPTEKSSSTMDFITYISVLPEKIQDMVLERCLGNTLEEIGIERNVCRERIRQKYNKAIENIKYRFESDMENINE